MGNKSQPSAQAGPTSEAAGVAGEVGVPQSSVDLHYFKRCQEPRGDTYSTRGGEAKDAGMAGATRIIRWLAAKGLKLNESKTRLDERDETV